MIGEVMQRVTILIALLAASLPLSAGILMPLDPTKPGPTDVGLFQGGTVLNITVNGTVSLNGTGIVTNPDGSLANGCPECAALGYGYFVQGQPYPGGGVNNFPGGGSNFDLLPDGHPPFAAEGNPTLDQNAPNVIRFGAVAYTFTANPQAADWKLLGYGGPITVPGSGLADLLLVVVDTYYPNNLPASINIDTGYKVEIDAAPEPAAMGLAFSGLLLLGGTRLLRRARRQS
jgi:hypothetical protein